LVGVGGDRWPAGSVGSMLPLHDDNPVRRPAVVTWLIIGACLVIYFLWQPSPFDQEADEGGIPGISDDTEFSVEHAAIPCELVEGRPLDDAEMVATFGLNEPEACNVDAAAVPEVADPRAQPFLAMVSPDKNVYLAVLTSMFLHGSLLHIGGNLLFLWIFGNNIEDVMGKIGYVVFYLVGGVVATLTHVVLQPDSTVPLVGASGAIAAVMGAYLVLFPRARVRTLIFALLIFFVELPAMVVLGVWFVLQFFTDPNEGVAWAAHVGGFVFGVAVGLVVRLLRNPPQAVGPTGPWSQDRGPYGPYPASRDRRWW
jgi:membrane associated rhomboid family serine protease